MVHKMKDEVKINIASVVYASILGAISILFSFMILVVFGASAEHAIPESERRVETQLLRLVRLGMAGQTISYSKFLGKTVCVIVDRNLDSLSKKQYTIINGNIPAEYFKEDSKYWYIAVFYNGDKKIYKYSRSVIPVIGSNICAENGNLIVSVLQSDNADIGFMFSDGDE